MLDSPSPAIVDAGVKLDAAIVATVDTFNEALHAIGMTHSRFRGVMTSASTIAGELAAYCKATKEGPPIASVKRDSAFWFVTSLRNVIDQIDLEPIKLEPLSTIRDKLVASASALSEAVFNADYLAHDADFDADFDFDDTSDDYADGSDDDETALDPDKFPDLDE